MEQRNGKQKASDMKNKYLMASLLCMWIAALPPIAAAQDQPARLTDHGLPAGGIEQVLPKGPLLYVQFESMHQILLDLERIAQTALPVKVLPPQMQELMQTEHPLLTALGGGLLQEPLTREAAAQKLGLDLGAPLSLAIYPGDPRKSFVLAVPMSRPEALTGLIQNALRPEQFESVMLGGKPAIRLQLRNPSWLSRLYVVCSANTAFFCGDRSMAIALHNTPSAERLNQDSFMKKVRTEVGGTDLALTFNPGLLKPFLIQAQQFLPVGTQMLQAQRQVLLQQIPEPVRQRLDLQMRRNFGVRDFDEFTRYAECFIVATALQLADGITQCAVAFEGMTLSVDLNAEHLKGRFFLFSHQVQPDRSTQPIPMDEVRKALAWLGPGYDGFGVTGRQPPTLNSPWFRAWLAQVRKQLEAQQLESKFLDRMESVTDETLVLQPVATRVPWVLTTCVTPNPPPSLREAASIEAYFRALGRSGGFPVQQTVQVIPRKDTAFLKQYFEEETRVLNHNEQLSRQFAEEMFQQTPWLDKSSRLESKSLPGGVAQFILENSWQTHAGIFGYDQHELINRRHFLARQIDGYLVYHQGAQHPDWLRNLAASRDRSLNPAVSRLLDQAPKDVHSIQVLRLLHHLPACIDWLEAFEERAQADIQEYIDKAAAVVREASSIEKALPRLQRMPMPFLVYSLNREESSGRFYCLLPGNVVAPRPKLVPRVAQLLADYAARSGEIGGSIAYSRVRPEVRECGSIQDLEGITSLISTVGNRLADRYLNDRESMRDLRRSVVTPKDMDRARLDEVLVRNPQWEFIPGPQPSIR